MVSIILHCALWFDSKLVVALFLMIVQLILYLCPYQVTFRTTVSTLPPESKNNSSTCQNHCFLPVSSSSKYFQQRRHFPIHFFFQENSSVSGLQGPCKFSSMLSFQCICTDASNLAPYLHLPGIQHIFCQAKEIFMHLQKCGTLCVVPLLDNNHTVRISFIKVNGFLSLVSFLAGNNLDKLVGNQHLGKVILPQP